MQDFETALGAVGKEVFYQIHFGADYASGAYGWSTDGETIRCSIEWQLAQLRTDYIDYGFIHCIDELSSRTFVTIQKILDEAFVDMPMFSINPGYDYQKGDYAKGSVDERSAVYSRCEKEEIGISVMKPFSGGQHWSSKGK